jgi:hypothetical protein
MVLMRPLCRPRRALLRGAAALVALPAFVSACARDDSASAARAGIRVLPTPRGGIVPAVQYDASSDRLHLLYLDGQDVFHVESSDAGASFGEPSRVNDKPKFANGGLFRGPELAIGSGGMLHAIWYSRAYEAKLDKSQQGVMYTRRSAGGTFEASRSVGGEPSDGYSLTVRDQQVALAWHNGEQLKLLRSDDGGRAFGAPTLLDALPCECCVTCLQITPQGAVLLAYRDRRDDRRDMYLAQVERTASPARKLKLDAQSWIIKACPISGSTLLLGAGQATAVWEHDGRVLLARVALPAWQRGEPLDIGAGKYPIVLDNGRFTLVAWVDGKKLRWKRFEAARMSLVDEGSLARKVMDRAAGAVSRGGEFVLVV